MSLPDDPVLERLLCAAWELSLPGLVTLGFSSGLSSTLGSVYITEVAGSSNKGVVSSMINFNITFGILLINVLGSMLRLGGFLE